MTKEKLELANKVHKELERLEENNLRFLQGSADFAYMHTRHPWCMLSDEEWERLTELIKDRYEIKIQQISLKFAEL